MAATVSRSVARHYVQLTITCEAPPTRDVLAFLGPLKAQVLTRDKELTVSLDVDATEIVDALDQARGLLIERIPDEIRMATDLRTEGVRFPPGRPFGRRRL